MAWIKISTDSGALRIEADGSMIELGGLLELAKLDFRCRAIADFEAARFAADRQSDTPEQKR